MDTESGKHHLAKIVSRTPERVVESEAIYDAMTIFLYWTAHKKDVYIKIPDLEISKNSFQISLEEKGPGIVITPKEDPTDIRTDWWKTLDGMVAYYADQFSYAYDMHELYKQEDSREQFITMFAEGEATNGAILHTLFALKEVFDTTYLFKQQKSLGKTT